MATLINRTLHLGEKLRLGPRPRLEHRVRQAPSCAAKLGLVPRHRAYRLARGDRIYRRGNTAQFDSKVSRYRAGPAQGLRQCATVNELEIPSRLGRTLAPKE